jgi:hypothetical protein
MELSINPLDSVLNFGSKLLDKFIPDPAQKAAAQLELLQSAQDGELKQLQVQMSAIIAEAQSSDPWTSRARPSFMYVIYVMILMSIPMGILSAFNPAMAVAISAGMKSWLSAVPDSLWTLFGVGYVGYTGARMMEKRKGVA